MIKTLSKPEVRAISRDLHAARGEILSSRQLFEALAKAIPYAETVVISTLPRGGSQIVQPQQVSENLFKEYAREYFLHDSPTWKSIAARRPLQTADIWDNPGESRFHLELLHSSGLTHVAAAPLKHPVLPGYPGAWHVYRNDDHGPFTTHELQELARLAGQFDELTDKSHASRHHQRPSSFSHQLPDKQLIFDKHLNVHLQGQLPAAMDEHLRKQIAEHAKTQLAQFAGQTLPGQRITFPDSRGELWVFRFVLYANYPALGDGPFLFYCLQPDCMEWAMVKPADFQADAELGRLIPALHFMQTEYARGPKLHEISRVVHLSPFHFHRRFTELLGITPKHYLLDWQIQSAKTQLLSGNAELVEIAKSCGFAHQSHFTSRFKQATGLTPTRWRKLAAEPLETPRA